MRFFKYLITVLVAVSVISCGTTRKAKKYAPTPYEVVISHIEKQDPFSLLTDLSEYPEYSYLIESQLYNSISYTKYDYAQINLLSQLSQDDFRASVFFDSLLIDRQEIILEQLSLMDIEEVGEFYRNNSSTMNFLKNSITEAYFNEMDSLDYYSLKTLHFAFLNTDFQRLIEPLYKSKRDSLLPKVIAELDILFKDESDVLSDIDSDLRADLDKYIENGVVEVISGLSEKLDRGIIKKVFQRQEVDRYSITEYTEKLIKENLNESEIYGIINKRYSDYIVSSRAVRYDYMSNYFEDSMIEKECYIPDTIYDNLQLNMIADRSDASKIQELKFNNTATTVASVALTFTGVGWIGLAVDAVDLYNGLTEESQIQTMLNDLTNSLYSSVSSSVNRYMKEVNSTIDFTREDSKQHIIKKFNEDF